MKIRNGLIIDKEDGSKRYYVNDKLHRLDGPAVEWEDGTNHWFYNDINIPVSSQEEFDQYLKLVIFK